MSSSAVREKKAEAKGDSTKEDINELVGKLSISSPSTKKFDDLPKPGPIFERELNKTPFTVFECKSDLGYFTWIPNNENYKSLSDVSSEEVRGQINARGTPDRLVPTASLGRLPKPFSSLPPQEHQNKYPYGQIDIACLHVATHHRGLNFVDHNVDFAFGGSTLEMLATKDASSSPYFVTLVPGTKEKTILVVKRKEYVQNFSDVGFQFERLVTGKRMEDRLPVEFTEHLHLMVVGGKYNVLFRAETDAMNKDGEPVEVKASNPRYWGTKVMFQMISSGSPKLCHGVKGRGQLTRVDLKDLSNVSRTAISGVGVTELEQNIVDGMDALKEQIAMHKKEEGSVFKVSFVGGRLKLLEVTTRSASALLPPADVVKELVA